MSKIINNANSGVLVRVAADKGNNKGWDHFDLSPGETTEHKTSNQDGFICYDLQSGAVLTTKYWLAQRKVWRLHNLTTAEIMRDGNGTLEVSVSAASPSLCKNAGPFPLCKQAFVRSLEPSDYDFPATK